MKPKHFNYIKSKRQIENFMLAIIYLKKTNQYCASSLHHLPAVIISISISLEQCLRNWAHSSVASIPELLNSNRIHSVVHNSCEIIQHHHWKSEDGNKQSMPNKSLSSHHFRLKHYRQLHLLKCHMLIKTVLQQLTCCNTVNTILDAGELLITAISVSCNMDNNNLN